MWLSDDFPHLKRLTIVLTHGCLLYDFPALQEICDLLGQNIAGLGWVHIVGLNNEDVVSSLKPMVCKSHLHDSTEVQESSTSAELETVQTHTTEYECFSGWKNVTLWRGSRESRPPFVPNPMAGTGRERKHLFRFETAGVVSYSAGSSFL